ncbi:hypothetical protein TRFO_39718 [Tritrichomonas foetus]|uniref:Uncharacterized protein n=1 Tax=Tritrichomonas foetus TaxID=1144522 RepID=A0A1J4J5Z2_9EUKA|nr:hypothetical protein TRFO_39718 [Tritrichomonas foetus]|eukprot:OHS94081.1 hypothetical protein TRFO_39718 [Tritrichomonas foetus]
MSKKEEKIRFSKMLEKKNKTLMDSIRRAWKQKLDDVERSKSTVDFQYESLQTRLENIATAVEVKTASIREENKKLKDDISNMKKSIGRAKAAIELRECDESSEIEIELRLKMQVEELRMRLQNTQNETDSLNERMQNYKSMYLKIENKKHKIQERRDNVEELKNTRLDLNDMLADFKNKIAQEQKNLDNDLRKLREMRENLIHPPPPKRTPQEEYRKYLMEAGQWVDEHQMSFAKTNDSVLYMNDENNSSDSNLPVNDHFSVINQKLDDATLEKIEFLENNIRTLLSTGNYKEDDPLISNIRKQINDLSGKNKK